MVASTVLPQHGCCYWLTGLPAAGKSTLAEQTWACMKAMGIGALVLDGDHLRQGLNADLQYSRTDRAENVRRVGEVAKLVAEAGLVAIVSVVSPYADDRHAVRRRFAHGRFFEVFVDTDLQTCMSRDPKGLYRKAREGQIADLTGFNAPYERSSQPDLVIQTTQQSPAQAANHLICHYISQLTSVPGPTYEQGR